MYKLLISTNTYNKKYINILKYVSDENMHVKNCKIKMYQHIIYVLYVKEMYYNTIIL